MMKIWKINEIQRFAWRAILVIDELIDEPIDWQRGKQKSSSSIGFRLIMAVPTSTVC